MPVLITTYFNFISLNYRFGYVEFSSMRKAKDALENLNGLDLDGRDVRLDYAKGPRGGGGRGGDDRRGGRGGGGGGGRGELSAQCVCVCVCGLASEFVDKLLLCLLASTSMLWVICICSVQIWVCYIKCYV